MHYSLCINYLPTPATTHTHRKTVPKTTSAWDYQIDRLMQERRNSIAGALELCLSCTNPLRWSASVSSFMWFTFFPVIQPPAWPAAVHCSYWPETTSFSFGYFLNIQSKQDVLWWGPNSLFFSAEHFCGVPVAVTIQPKCDVLTIRISNIE